MGLDTVRRRQAIEAAASELFRERGYAATSVRDIARALDIQGASLYSHVTSKEDVLWAIVDRAASAFEAAADDALASDGGPRVRLAALVRAHVAIVTADPELVSVFVREWRHLSPDRRDAILARRDAYERRVRDLIAEGVVRGELGERDPVLAAAFLLTALNGIATWYRRAGRLDPEMIADGYVGLAVGALSAVVPTDDEEAAR